MTLAFFMCLVRDHGTVKEWKVLETESESLPYTLHFIALDKLLDLFKTWLSHLLNGKNGVTVLEFLRSYIR